MNQNKLNELNVEYVTFEIVEMPRRGGEFTS